MNNFWGIPDNRHYRVQCCLHNNFFFFKKSNPLATKTTIFSPKGMSKQPKNPLATKTNIFSLKGMSKPPDLVENPLSWQHCACLFITHTKARFSVAVTIILLEGMGIM